MSSKHHDVELNYEIPMTEDRLREILNHVAKARSMSRPGQTLRVKVTADTVLVFHNLVDFKTTNAITRSSEETLHNERHESGLN